MNLANISAHQGEADEARREFVAGLQLVRKLEDPYLLCGVLANLGVLCAQMKDQGGSSRRF